MSHKPTSGSSSLIRPSRPISRKKAESIVTNLYKSKLQDSNVYEKKHLVLSKSKSEEKDYKPVKFKARPFVNKQPFVAMKSTKKLTIPANPKLTSIKRSESQKLQISQAFNGAADQFESSMKKFNNLLNTISDKNEINKKIQLLERSAKYMHTDLPRSGEKKQSLSFCDTVQKIQPWNENFTKMEKQMFSDGDYSPKQKVQHFIGSHSRPYRVEQEQD